jgi:hypothetical protein
MASGHMVLVMISLILLAPASHLQAARMLAPSDNPVRREKFSVSTRGCTKDNECPSAKGEKLIPAALPQKTVDQAAEITRGEHGRALWSTPSDGVGH